MVAERTQVSGTRNSLSIRFIDQFLTRRSSEQLTGLLVAQIDALNRISTTFGTEKSAEFCAEYAEQLRARMPKGTPIIRLSDQRFAILTTQDSMNAIVDLTLEITETLQPEMQVQDDSYLVDLAIGMAVCPTHADDGESLFRRADLALKSAQESELSYDIYRADATKQQATLWKLESDLRTAVQNRELEVHFQPKIDLAAHKVSGVEALVRWRIENGRILLPDDFIPLAERSGTIVPLTWLVFDRVRDAVIEWGRFDEPFEVAVNLAPQAVRHSEFRDRLRRLRNELEKFNVSVTIELTEDSLLKCDKDSLANLHAVREMGIGLAIDDFGKGYSSLTYLKELPATELKIDRAFIESIGADKTNQHIVTAIVGLAHALGMRVVAEGINSEQDLAKVAELGCELAQGYLIAKPMRPELLLPWKDDNYPGSVRNSVSIH
jgi:predicted signal transduction protein with EAL and GGDEF domain